MDLDETMEMDPAPMEPRTTKTFTFSPPSVHPRSPKILSPTQTFDKIFDTALNKNPTFTFAAPMTLAESIDDNEPASETSATEKHYKPRISRNTYKPSANVFAQALKDTAVYEQLKKHSRSRAAKVNIDNSITCINVPKALINKQSAKEYFASFGNILKITIRPKKRIITVNYASKEEASTAHNQAGEYMEEKFDIEWSKTFTEPKSPTKKKDIQKNIVTHLLKSEDDEVKSELAAIIVQDYNVPGSTESKEPPLLKRRKAQQAKGTSKPAPKPDKHKTDSQISNLLPNASAEELQSMIQQAALTSEDKYKVLEARDRLMRLKQVKSHSLATAKVTSGTCPDMCPEKERLMREAKRQVALYELESNEYKIIHSIAVKQYSRSSADQEEPMPHDLRPVKSLKMAMSYLLHEIVNLCDQPGTNLGEWYHFLWDRTRGIRKDITQQELCCTESVELVEQCARFHIVCSERLGEEDASVFDKKINSDNLTKCLQSLKYMYHDLGQKGISCKNEPEFRAYIILLNLNSGSFVWELQRLPEAIQKSPKVQFALEIYKALESNNYCKFFKLVKDTTYLNACILLRYFYQVRLKALTIMVKAYCRTMSTAFPLYELIDILGFEDENEAIYFCEQLGLNVSRDELHVLLNRQNFSMPELNMKQSRACNLIESKRVSQNLTIGQCIAGCKMPEKTYKYHKPHSSFDSKGFLLPKAISAEDQTKSINMEYDQVEEEEIENIPKTSVGPGKEQFKLETSMPNRSTHIFTPATFSDVARSITNISKPATTFSFATAASVQPGTKPELSQPIKQTTEKQIDLKATPSFTKTQSNVSTNMLPNIFSMASAPSKENTTASKLFPTSQNKETVSPFTPPTSKNIFSAPTQKNIFAWTSTPSNIFGSTSSVQTTLEFKTAISSDDNKSKLVQSTRPETLSAKEEPSKIDTKRKEREEEERKRIQQVNNDMRNLLDDLQNDVVETICSDIVHESIDRIQQCNIFSEQVVNETIEDVCSEIGGDILKEELENEKQLHEMKIKAKNRAVLKYLNAWRRYAYKRKRQREALNDTPVWLQRYPIDRCAQLLYSKEQETVIRSMSKPSPEIKIEKSYIQSLAPIEVIIYTGIKETLKSQHMDTKLHFYYKLVISWPDLREEPLLRQYKKITNKYLNPDDYTADSMLKVYRPNQFESLQICIKNFEGLINDQHLTGTDGLLIVASTSEDTKFVTRRLTKTILSRQKLMPMPLVFIALGDGDLEALNKAVVPDLEVLTESGYLSDYTIMFERHFNEKTILNLTQSAVLWLAVNRSKPNPLEMNYLHDVLDVCLTEELWLRISSDSPFNAKLWYALKDPCFIIKLHNEAVSHLTDILLDHETFMYTQFAPEFKKFLNIQDSLPCSYELFDDELNEEEYKADIERAISKLTLPQWKYQWPVSDAEELRENIAVYSREALPEYNSNAISSSLLSNLFLTSGTFNISNFIEILLYIVREKIRQIDGDLKVIYNRYYVKHFCTLPWWFKSHTFADYQLSNEQILLLDSDEENDRTYEHRIKKRKVYKFGESVSQNDSSMEYKPLATFCEKTQSGVMDVYDTAIAIEDLLSKQKEQSFLFEERLQNALLNDSDPLL